MKAPQITLYLLLFGLLIIGSSNTNSSTTLIWESDRKLSWDDFQGKPDYNFDDVSALTSSGIIHYKGCEDGNIVYKVQAYFEKTSSWVKPEAYTNHHLSHEQIHFDITELYARKLRKSLEKRKFRCGEEERFDAFVANFLRKWQTAQIRYDNQTHYSMKPAIQNEWKYLIAMELSLYDSYRNTEGF